MLFDPYYPPRAPTAPTKTFRKTVEVGKDKLDNYMSWEIGEFEAKLAEVKQLGATKLSLEVYAGHDETEIVVSYYRIEETKNKEYKKQYEDYKKLLAKYKQDLKKWKEQKKEFDKNQEIKAKELRRKNYENLKKEFEAESAESEKC